MALIEGVRLVEEALGVGVNFRAILTSPALESTERGRTLKQRLAQCRVPSAEYRAECRDDQLADLAATEHPQGVLAVIEPPRWKLDDIRISSTSVVVILDAIQDPGNVGTIVRTAHGLAASGLIALPGTAELTSPKTLRATMGSLFRFPAVAAPEPEAAAWLAAQKATIAATDARGQPFDPARLPRPLGLVLGNEAGGARSPLAAGASLLLAIPLAAPVESLNVAVAAGIFLHGVRP